MTKFIAAIHFVTFSSFSFRHALSVAAALFSSRRPKNFENEKIFLCLKIAEIDMGGSILGRKERSWIYFC